MSADLERLLSNRQEMALVKRLVATAMKGSNGESRLTGENVDDCQIIEIKNKDHVDAHARRLVLPAVSKAGMGDGPLSETAMAERLNAIFIDGNPDPPRPTVFTRPKTMLT